MALRFQSQELVKPVDIIFSCAVCQRTLSDIYPTGLEKGDAMECRLWLAECGHVICDHHLTHPGKPPSHSWIFASVDTDWYTGAMLHNQKTQTRATCPVCRDETNNTMERRVFAITGRDLKSHASNIPPIYFKTPPYEFDTSDPQLSAIMFQYQALARYGAMMQKRYALLKSGLNSTNIEKSKTEEMLAASELQNMDLRDRIEELKDVESKISEWKKTKKLEINRQFSSFLALKRENSQLKTLLTTLGCEVPKTTWAFQNPLSDDNLPSRTCHQPSFTNGDVLEAPFGRLGVQPDANAQIGQAIPSSPPKGFSPIITRMTRKRQLEDQDSRAVDPNYSRHPKRPSSSKLMPPPPIPARRVSVTPNRRGSLFQGLNRFRPASCASNKSLTNLPATPLPTIRRLSTSYPPINFPEQLHSSQRTERPESRELRTVLASDYPEGQSFLNTPIAAGRSSEDANTCHHFEQTGTARISSNDPHGATHFTPNERHGLALDGDEVSNNIQARNSRPMSRAWTTPTALQAKIPNGRAAQLTPMSTTTSYIVEPRVENELPRTPQPKHYSLNALSFVNHPYSSTNRPVTSVVDTAVGSSTLLHPMFRHQMAIPVSSQQSSIGETSIPRLDSSRPLTASIDRSSSIEIGAPNMLANISHSSNSHHRRPQRRISLRSLGPYSLGIRSSRTGRTATLYAPLPQLIRR